MSIYYSDDSVTLHHGDCIEVMRTLPDNSVDSVVTDPPYGLEFMGKGWDAPWQKGTNVNADAGFSDVAMSDGFKRLPRPSFTGSTNPVCQTCGGKQRGRKDESAIVRACAPCDNPRFPNVRAVEMRAFGEWCELWTAECLRVLKPGGHLLAFGGTRTWHRLACAVEDAGFEVRDSIAWLYGSGFPKSLDVSKAIDKAAGAEREVVREWAQTYSGGAGADAGYRPRSYVGKETGRTPATPAAEQWQGFGTALKPAFEPVVVARKPLSGTVAANVLEHGTGALNIDGARIAGAKPDTTRGASANASSMAGPLGGQGRILDDGKGRWPANVILDESQAEALDEQSGDRPAGGKVTGRQDAKTGDSGIYGKFGAVENSPYDDTGGASRFFYVARKDTESCPTPDPASTAASASSQPNAPADSARSGAAISEHPDTDRPTDSPSTNGTPTGSRPSAASDTQTTPTTADESSRDWQPVRPSQMVSRARYAASLSPTDTTTTTASPSISDGSAAPATFSTTQDSDRGVPLDALGSRFTYVAKADQGERPKVDGVAHPTVKPLELMRWLVRLVTPPGGTVLEPFAGSGTTVEACILERFQCIAIEKTDEYLPLTVARIHRRRDPVAAIKLAGDDLGLFEMGDAS